MVKNKLKMSGSLSWSWFFPGLSTEGTGDRLWWARIKPKGPKGPGSSHPPNVSVFPRNEEACCNFSDPQLVFLALAQERRLPAPPPPWLTPHVSRDGGPDRFTATVGKQPRLA
jgi:hypothetical protein